MSNQVTLSPLEKENIKLFFSSYETPQNTEEFERLSLVRKTYEKHWTLQANDSEEDFLEVFVIDGHHKRNVIQIFTKALKTVGCTCETFHTNHLGFCEHLALIERLRKGHINTTDEKAWHAILKRFNQLPAKREQYTGRTIRVFKPYEQEYVILGRRTNGICEDSVGCPLNGLVDYEKRHNDFFVENKEITSKGLLKEVSLYDYQEEIFAKMLASKHCICSMIMGSGKTITSIAAFEWLRQNKNKDIRMLIIAPKSLKLQWGREVERCIGLSTIQINNLKDLKEYEKNNHQIAAVTYQFATRHINHFRKLNYDMIIFDEIQYVRNDETKAWRAMAQLHAEYMFGLSGTVIENRLEDLYSVMEILAPGYLGPKWKFSTEYQKISVITKTTLLFDGIRNIEKLRNQLKYFLFSYHQLELPKIHHQYHTIPLGYTERKYHDEYYDQAKILMSKMLTSGLSRGEKLILQAFLLKARQCTNTEQLITKQPTQAHSGKIQKFIKMVDEICIGRKEKIVVFSSWTEMLGILGDILRHQLGIGHVFFTGAQNLAARKKAVDKFLSDDKCQVFLASDAGGLGLDGLQYAATNIIHFELPWNPAKVDQRNARIHRIGQTKEVFCHYLTGEDSIETQMQNTLYKKREIRNEVLYNGKTEDSVEDVPSFITIPVAEPIVQPPSKPTKKVAAKPPRQRLIPAF